MLDARIAESGGKVDQAVALLREAAALEDELAYDEPSAWNLPVRETLGRLLLAGGKAAEAEGVFREDFKRNPRSGRSLLGLREALRAQGKAYDAEQVDRQFREAWRNAEKPLSIGDL
jgi:tetratricopeptide (TPR) repeat protein